MSVCHPQHDGSAPQQAEHRALAARCVVACDDAATLVHYPVTGVWECMLWSQEHGLVPLVRLVSLLARS